MSKTLFRAVKELIDEKKYAEARIILKTIDDPKARQWEAAVDELDPPSIGSFFERVPVSAEERKRNLKILFAFLCMVVVLILVANMLGVQYAVNPKAAQEASRTAEMIAIRATEVSINATSAAINATNVAEIQAQVARRATNQYFDQLTAQFFYDRRHASLTAEMRTEIAFRPTREARLHGNQSTYEAQATNDEATRVAIPTKTPIPTAVYTPVAPTIYYALDTILLFNCPYDSCPRFHRVSRGNQVVVIGIVDGSFNSLNSNKWYKIQVEGGTMYQFVEWFSKTPPTQFQHSVFVPTPGYQPTPRPTATYGPSPTRYVGPTYTPRPTPTRPTPTRKP